MIGTFVIIVLVLVATCIYFGIAVARRMTRLTSSLLQLGLIVFGICYAWAALTLIWIHGASVLHPDSLLHAFGPGEMPALFLKSALLLFVPAMGVAAISFAVSRGQQQRNADVSRRGPVH